MIGRQQRSPRTRRRLPFVRRGASLPPTAPDMSHIPEPRHVDWASPEVLSACGVIVVHAASPRVFLWDANLLTEGLLDYLRRPDVLSEPDADLPFGSTTAVDDDEGGGRA